MSTDLKAEDIAGDEPRSVWAELHVDRDNLSWASLDTPSASKATKC